MKHLAKCGIVISLIVLIATSLVACDSEAVSPSTKESPATFEPIEISGSSDMTSPPFTVTTKEWTIDWSYVPNTEYPGFATFVFFVYPRGETEMYVESMINAAGTSGSTYSYAGAGDYYVVVIAGNVNSWKIVISPA